SSRRRHTRWPRDWSSDVCSSDLDVPRKAARKQAMAMIATMMGTIVLARVAGDGDFSDEILGAGRETALARATPTKPAAGKSAPRSEERRVGKEGRAGGASWATEK